MAFAEVAGIALHYSREGDPDGTPLVFINSLGTDLRIWDGLLPYFSGRYAVIRYDKRGHGLSDCPPAPYSIQDHAADLAKLLDRLKIPAATLVGISVGGMIALEFAATWPDRTLALALSDTAAVIGTAGMWNERITGLRQHGMAALSESILSRWFSPSFVSREPATYRGYANMLARTPVEGYTGTCEAIRDADLREAARSISVPTLVLCGAEDSATPPPLVRGLCDLIPHADYQEIPDAAHLPCIEQPGIMATHMIEFL
jgi:3-oxoadipate enol-lactonase